MTIKLECFGGEEISDAFMKALDLANRIEFDVEFEFNGVTCFVKPGGSVTKGIREYDEAISGNKSHRFASAN